MKRFYQKWKKYLAYAPLCAIVIAILIITFSQFRHSITFATIKQYHETWKALAVAHPLWSGALFISLLTLSVCFVLPNTILLGTLAGFLFPLPLAIFYIALSETLGAYLFFEAVRIAFVPALHKKNKQSFFWKLEKKVQANQISYLLFFRFTHFIPFFLLNTAAACFQIKRWTFIWTTCVGILPLSYILAQGGSGLNTFIESNTHFSLTAIFNTKVKFALMALGILALLPLIWKFTKKHWP